MGKVKSRRHRFDAAAKRKKGEEEKTNAASAAEVVEMDGAQSPIQSPFKMPENPFTSLQIDMSRVKQDLPDFDTRSAITSKSFRGTNLTKVEKRKLKRDFLNKKIDAIKAAKEEAKARKKRQNTPVVGDMKGLADALPTLDLLMKETPKQKGKTKHRISTKPFAKTRTRQKCMMDDIAAFKQVLKHPAFKADPQGTMREHVKNWTDLQNKADS